MSGLSVDDPVTLTEAVDSPNIIPGDTIYLRGGIYDADYISTLSGTEENPITILPYNEEPVIIDGALTINGPYTIWKDLIITYSGWEKRTTEISGSEPADMPIDKSVTINARSTKIINCVIHDNAGFYTMSQSAGSEIYGNILYRFGWSGPDRGHVHGIYAQNRVDYPRSTVADNISFEHFATGLKFYSEGGNFDNYQVEGNACFNNGILYDRGNGSSGAHHHWDLLLGGLNIGRLDSVVDNMTYNITEQGARGNNGIAWGAGMDSPIITGNYMVGRDITHSGTSAGPILTPTVSGNTFIGPAARFTEYPGNNFIDWPGTGLSIFVRPNKYKNTRANVIIYNWDGLDSVSVDLSAVPGLSAGSVVQIRNVQNYFYDIFTRTLDENKRVTIDMRTTSRTVGSPLLWTAAPSTFPLFGCFVVN